SGEASPHDGALLSAVALTSKTQEEWHQGMLLAYLRCNMSFQVFQMVLSAQHEFTQTLSKNMSDDEYDSSGNLIRTAAERLRDMIEAERLRELPMQRSQLQSFLMVRGVAIGRVSNAMARVGLARSPSEKQTASTALDS